MGPKQQYRVVFDDGSEYTIPNLYSLGIFAKYKRQGCIVYTDPPTKLSLNFCDGCNRKFADLEIQEVTLSRDKELNARLGYVGRLCIDCSYWILRNQGCFIPPAIEKVLVKNFEPTNLI